MKLITQSLLIAFLSIFTTILFAVNITKSINLNISYTPYVKLLGSAAGATKYFAVTDIQPAGNRGPGPTVSIGLLGVESNIAGSCTLDFSTINNFRLKHTVSNKRLTNYRLNYKNKRINRRNTSMVLASCNEAQSSLDFTATGRFRRNVKSGIYQDIVTITVTTQ